MSADTYTQTTTYAGVLGGEPLLVAGKPGLEGGAAIGDAAILAADLVAPASDERVALLGCGNGALGVALARRLPAGHLTLSDPSLIARRLARLTLAASGVVGVEVSDELSLLPGGAGAFDRVVVLVPASRALGRRWLAETHALLRPGGLLSLAGANRAGVQPLIADAAALFGAAHTLGYGRGCRVAEAVRRDEPPVPPPWAAAPGIAPGTWHILRVDLPDGPAEMLSLPGIFSYDRLDEGTALLLEHLGPCRGLRVLDAGCGYGPLGVAAARLGADRVTMLDVNALAVAAAQANSMRLGLGCAEVAASDALEAAAGATYDLIVSNPPFHAGKTVDTAMAAAFIGQARALLAPGGRLVLVANRFLPYERHMALLFARVSVVVANRGFRVLAGEG
jgi:16S rRNA (guanine1207-N2)-methyltransferase